MERRLHFSARSLRRNGYAVELDSASAGWSYAGLRVLELRAGESRDIATGTDEVVVLSLSGSASVRVDEEEFDLAGRRDVFSGISDFVYAPIGSTVHIFSRTGGRFALPSSRASRRLPSRHVAAWDVPVELRGAGNCSRQIVNFCVPQAFEADRLIACEVLTPAGNWSSFPPHKHDEETSDETSLEEIYYYEVAECFGHAGAGYQRVYGAGERPIEVCAEVRSGDVVLVPHGWHGPSIATPGSHLYYLNVMAGPGIGREWRISFDPAYLWVRELWERQAIDRRLPLIRAAGGVDGG
jgi:5-deoxy-glucuronate isomerase